MKAGPGKSVALLILRISTGTPGAARNLVNSVPSGAMTALAGTESHGQARRRTSDHRVTPFETELLEMHEESARGVSSLRHRVKYRGAGGVEQAGASRVDA